MSDETYDEAIKRTAEEEMRQFRELLPETDTASKIYLSRMLTLALGNLSAAGASLGLAHAHMEAVNPVHQMRNPVSDIMDDVEAYMKGLQVAVEAIDEELVKEGR